MKQSKERACSIRRICTSISNPGIPDLLIFSKSPNSNIQSRNKDYKWFSKIFFENRLIFLSYSETINGQKKFSIFFELLQFLHFHHFSFGRFLTEHQFQIKHRLQSTKSPLCWLQRALGFVVFEWFGAGILKVWQVSWRVMTCEMRWKCKSVRSSQRN